MVTVKLGEQLGKRLLKISKVAAETGISRTTLTNLYYRKAKGITLETLGTLCAYLNCSVADLLEYVPEDGEK